MQSIPEQSMFQRLKKAISHVKGDTSQNYPFMLIASVEENATLDKPHPTGGWLNREAGMVSIRADHGWHGEVFVVVRDQIANRARKHIELLDTFSLEELHNNPKYRGCFNKSYPTPEMTGSQVARELMSAFAEELIREGYMLYNWYADRGPSNTPDRKVSLTLYNVPTKHTAIISCNIIESEWQDPELAAFRVKGSVFNRKEWAHLPTVDPESVEYFLTEVLPGLTYSSAEAFQQKYDELVKDKWTARALVNNQRVYRLVMVDEQKTHAKILVHRM